MKCSYMYMYTHMIFATVLSLTIKIFHRYLGPNLYIFAVKVSPTFYGDFMTYHCHFTAKKHRPRWFCTKNLCVLYARKHLLQLDSFVITLSIAQLNVDARHIYLVRSTLEYGAIIWDPYLQSDIDKKNRKSTAEGCSFYQRRLQISGPWLCFTNAQGTWTATSTREKEATPIDIHVQGGWGIDASHTIIRLFWASTKQTQNSCHTF